MSKLLFEFPSPEEARDYVVEFRRRHELSIATLLAHFAEAGLYGISEATFYRWMKKPGSAKYRIQLLATTLKLLEERGCEKKREVA